MDAGGYDFLSTRMHSKVLWKSPIKGGILASVRQSVLDSQVVHNPVLDYAWHIIPDQDDNYLVLFAYLSVINKSGNSYLAITVITAIKLLFINTTGKYALAS